MVRFLHWLSGVGQETLAECPNWERAKYAAFGATVLVPSLFAFIACSYALSTLGAAWSVILPVSLVWAFIIMTIDRALLASYRPYAGFFRKLGQFCLRFVVALLMGLTIAHPVTLLVFSDTIRSEIETDRRTELDGVRATFLAEKQQVETAITGLEEQISAERDRWNASFNADFITEKSVEDVKLDTDEEKDAALVAAQEEATVTVREQLAETETQLASANTKYQTIQEELNHWQTEFERELNGQRSGIIGLGPRARSIQTDQLAWRREEGTRLSGEVQRITDDKARILADIAHIESRIAAEFEVAQSEADRRKRAEQSRVDELNDMIQRQQAGQFVVQQNLLRDTIKLQIDARLEELGRMQEEIGHLSADERERIAEIKAEPRGDILKQTLALHKVFDRGEEGGKFALVAYIILTLLFMLVDTIPLIVKFFCKAGPYDTLVDRDEVTYEQDRSAFLAAHHRYRDELDAGRLITLTKNRPLEHALVDGVERSRVAKEFLDSLLGTERAFEERMAEERLRIAETEEAGHPAHLAREKLAMLEEMSGKFYNDLHERMQAFFDLPQAERR